MVTKVVMPKYGWTMTEGKVLKWLKKEGELVKKGEPLFEMESEKTVTQVEAEASGILRKILVQEGTVVPVGETIAILTEPGEELPSSDTLKQMVEEKPQIVEEEKIKISPAARKLAEEHGIDITKIKGTGPDGRIVKEDILRVIESEKEVVKVSSLPAKIIPLEGMRKIIAERMALSARTTARVLLTIDVDMSEVSKLRQSLLEDVEKKWGVRLTYTDILVKAVAKALEEHPIVNSILVEDKIHVMESINIGVAVALKDGLIVPVVREANKKSLIEIALQLKELIEKARQGKLSTEEATGGTFTISNLGMYGVGVQMQIINPPEVAILGVGAITDKPVVINGQISIRPMMTLSLVFDHRALDGAPAAEFLVTLKRILENPYILLI
uniref:2-oxo acid dehydrogenase subunit E2 n=1 Tax=Fervidicoccus fontis TaxID=683846 RepID=A0A7J3SKX1_9CREN